MACDSLSGSQARPGYGGRTGRTAILGRGGAGRASSALVAGGGDCAEVALTPEAKELVCGDVLRKAVQGWMAMLGPGDVARRWARGWASEPAEIWAAMLVLEMQGRSCAASLRAPPAQPVTMKMWSGASGGCCSASIRRTLAGLRKQIEPVTPAVYMRWLLRWQRVAPRATERRGRGAGGAAAAGGI